MFITRRAVLSATVATTVLTVPKRALAIPLPMTKDLLADFKKLDDRESEMIKKNTIAKISRWEAFGNDESVMTSLSKVRYDFLLDLYFKAGTFTKPMDMFWKSVARRKMAIMYESARTDDEKELVMAVIKYYELLE